MTTTPIPSSTIYFSFSPSNSNGLVIDNNTALSPIFARLQGKKGELFKVLYQKGIVDHQGMLTSPLSFPPLPSKMVSYLKTLLPSAFFDALQKCSPEFSLKADTLYVTGEYAAYLLFQEEFGYLEMLFKALHCADIYEHYVKGITWIEKPPFITLKTSIQHGDTKTTVNENDLNLLFEHFKKDITGEFQVSKARGGENIFLLMTFPATQIRWMWEAKLKRPCLFNVDEFSISLSSSQQLFPSSQLKRGAQSIFDILLGVLDTVNPEEIDTKGWNWYANYRTSGYTCREETLEKCLQETGMRSLDYIPSEKEKTYAFYSDYQISLSKLPLSEEKKWGLHFNHWLSFKTRFQESSFELLSPPKNPLFQAFYTLSKCLPFNVFCAYLDGCAEIALSQGAEIVERTHYAFKEEVYQIQAGEHLVLYWTPDLKRSVKCLKELGSAFANEPALEALLSLLLKTCSPKNKGPSLFPFETALFFLENDSFFLQTLSILSFSSLSHSDLKKVRTLCFKKAPDFYLKQHSLELKQAVKNAMESLFEVTLPPYTIEEEGMWRTWMRFHLARMNQFPESKELLCDLLSRCEHQETLNNFLSHIPSLAVTFPTTAQSLIVVVHKRASKSSFSRMICQSICELGGKTEWKAEDKTLFLYLIQQLKQISINVFENENAIFIKAYTQALRWLIVDKQLSEVTFFIQKGKEEGFWTQDILKEALTIASKQLVLMAELLCLLSKNSLDIPIGKELFPPLAHAFAEHLPTFLIEKETRDLFKEASERVAYWLRQQEEEKAFSFFLSAQEKGLVDPTSFGQWQPILTLKLKNFALKKNVSEKETIEWWELLKQALSQRGSQRVEALERLEAFLKYGHPKNNKIKLEALELFLIRWNEIKEDFTPDYPSLVSVFEKQAPFLRKHLSNDAIEVLEELLALIFTRSTEKTLQRQLIRTFFLGNFCFPSSINFLRQWLEVLSEWPEEGRKKCVDYFQFVFPQCLKFPSLHEKLGKLWYSFAVQEKGPEFLEKAFLLTHLSSPLKESCKRLLVSYLKEIKSSEKKLEWIKKICLYDNTFPQELVDIFQETFKKYVEQKPLESATLLLDSPIFQHIEKPELVLIHQLVVKALITRVENTKDEKKSKDVPPLIKTAALILTTYSASFRTNCETLWLFLLKSHKTYLPKEFKAFWEHLDAAQIFEGSPVFQKLGWIIALTFFNTTDVKKLISMLSDPRFKQIFITPLKGIAGTVTLFKDLLHNCAAWQEEPGIAFDHIKKHYLLFQGLHPSICRLNQDLPSKENLPHINKEEYFVYKSTMVFNLETLPELLVQGEIAFVESDSLSLFKAQEEVDSALIHGLLLKKNYREAFEHLSRYLAYYHTAEGWKAVALFLNLLVSLLEEMKEDNCTEFQVAYIDCLHKILFRYALDYMPGVTYDKAIPALLEIASTLVADIPDYALIFVTGAAHVFCWGCKKDKLAERPGALNLFKSIFRSLFTLSYSDVDYNLKTLLEILKESLPLQLRNDLQVTGDFAHAHLMLMAREVNSLKMNEQPLERQREIEISAYAQAVISGLHTFEGYDEIHLIVDHSLDLILTLSEFKTTDMPFWIDLLETLWVKITPKKGVKTLPLLPENEFDWKTLVLKNTILRLEKGSVVSFDLLYDFAKKHLDELLKNHPEDKVLTELNARLLCCKFNKLHSPNMKARPAKLDPNNNNTTKRG